MASKLGSVYVQIKEDLTPLVKGLRKAKSRVTSFAKSAKSALGSISKSVLSLKTAFIGMAVYGVGRLISSFEELSKKQEQVESTVQAAMISMGRYDDIAFRQVKQRAAELQEMSTFGDEAILEGTKFLMTYGEISDRLMPRVMETMTDLAALMGGNFVSAANMLGKASMGLIGSLRLVGVSVDRATYESEGFEGVLRQIEQQVSGQAEALRRTKSGGLEAFGNVVGDVKEKFGLFTSSVKAQIAEDLLPYLKQLDEYLQTWSTSDDFANSVKTIGTAISDYIINGIPRMESALWDLRETILDIEAAVYHGWAGIVEDTKAVLWIFRKLWELSGWIEEKIYDIGDAVKSAWGYFKEFVKVGDWVMTPFVKMSPPQPWKSGIEEMKADIKSVVDAGGKIVINAEQPKKQLKTLHEILLEMSGTGRYIAPSHAKLAAAGRELEAQRRLAATGGFGYQKGLENASRDMIVKIHKGESITTATQNKRRKPGVGDVHFHISAGNSTETVRAIRAEMNRLALRGA